jgi:hypothetical protein
MDYNNVDYNNMDCTEKKDFLSKKTKLTNQELKLLKECSLYHERMMEVYNVEVSVVSLTDKQAEILS